MRYGICLLALVVATAGCMHSVRNNLPPSEMLAHPGPGVDGPGPGVMMYPPPPPAIPAQTAQIQFVAPDGMSVHWDVTAPGAFDSQPLVVPAKYDFPQGAMYRLKLTNIAGRPGVELYPTLEVGNVQPRTAAFLAHNSIPVQFTNEDLDQVLSGNFVTKVIYLPDPEFQELAVAGVDTLVSTRLDPGQDPISEADRRGAILAIVRVGNKDLQMSGASAAAAAAAMPAGMMVGPNGLPCPAPAMGLAGNMTMPAGYVSGVSGPQWGMPMSGTPIGLPGPPHVPLGIPAGLQQHKIVNWTPTHIPAPTERVLIDVKQTPGMSYPKPVNYVNIHEHTQMVPNLGHQPWAERRQVSYDAAQGEPCPTAQPCPTTAPPAGPQN